MVKTLCWILVSCIVMYVIGALSMLFFPNLIVPYFLIIVFFIGVLSAVLLIVTLIIQRIKDKEEEKDDLSKY